MPEISAGWGPPVTLGAQRPAGGAATSRFATELRPLSVGRGFFVFAFILLAIGAVALSYGNAPAKRIQSCEKMGVGQAVCAAAEWDSEKVNVLPRYNPSLNKVIAAAQLAPAARQQDNNSVVRA